MRLNRRASLVALGILALAFWISSHIHTRSRATPVLPSEAIVAPSDASTLTVQRPISIDDAGAPRTMIGRRPLPPGVPALEPGVGHLAPGTTPFEPGVRSHPPGVTDNPPGI